VRLVPPILTVTEFTDPACPFAFSAEPSRLRAQWLYADHDLAWNPRMVVLARDAQEYADKGVTPEMIAGGAQHLSAAHGMPMSTEVRDRVAGTLDACTAVVATRLHAPEKEAAILRRLRLRHFDGADLDAQATIDGAATDVGLDPSELAAWMAEDDVKATVEADATAARHPSAAALVLDHKLAGWEQGRRYTCPSWELVPGDNEAAKQVAPGFQPWATYDVVLANLLPGVERRADAETVREVLEWAGEPLAAAEVAAVCGIDVDAAEEQLAEVATRVPLGNGALWALNA
jgi:predicted DsbA family dithiol-disulfide isomerase